MTPVTNTLKRDALKLRLSGLLGSLELRLRGAESHRLPYAEFLELIFQDALNVRRERQLLKKLFWGESLRGAFQDEIKIRKPLPAIK